VVAHLVLVRWLERRSAIMSAREWIRVLAVGVFAFGALCFPSVARSPRSYGSGFFILSDTGSLMWLAIILILAGVVGFVLSFVDSR
jgi:hypothetical protein